MEKGIDLWSLKAPIVTPVDSSSDDKENSGEFIDVEVGHLFSFFNW